VGSHPEILRKRTGKWGESYCTSPAFSAKMKKFLNQKKRIITGNTMFRNFFKHETSVLLCDLEIGFCHEILQIEFQYAMIHYTFM
jgi:hypothetical protein